MISTVFLIVFRVCYDDRYKCVFKLGNWRYASYLHQSGRSQEISADVGFFQTLNDW